MEKTDYYYIDIGVNFAGHGYSDEIIKLQLEKFYENYGESVISISNSPKEIPENRRLSNLPFKCKFYYTAGCHPHQAKDMRSESQFLLIENTLKSDSRCLCIGEIGLDYNRMFSPKDIQISVFERQIELAKRLNKPMYLHCRDAHNDFVKCIKKIGYYNGVVHCFTGTLQEALEFVNLGFKLGVTGWLLDARRNAGLIETVTNIPLEHLMIETDAPFMALKGQKRSVPSNVITISKEIARLKGISETDCARTLYNNTKMFFSI